MHATTKRVIGVDLGGTNIRAAVCDEQGARLEHAAQPTRAMEGPEAVLKRIIDTIRRATERTRLDEYKVGAIGVASPGPIDPDRGIILESPNLPGMINFPLKARLDAEFGVPTFVGNDANLAALGEHRHGAGQGIKNMVYVTISTGIGGGIIADGQLYLGWRGFAGEVGHQTLEARGPKCNCGNVGCLEVLASGPAIARQARQALDAGRESLLRSLAGSAEVTTTMVAQAAEKGDALALELFRNAGFYIGLGLVNLLHILDTELFVLGGGVALHTWDFLYPSISQTLIRNAMPSMRDGVRVVQAALGDDAGLVGAASLALDGLESQTRVKSG